MLVAHSQVSKDRFAVMVVFLNAGIEYVYVIMCIQKGYVYCTECSHTTYTYTCCLTSFVFIKEVGCLATPTCYTFVGNGQIRFGIIGIIIIVFLFVFCDICIPGRNTQRFCGIMVVMPKLKIC